MTDNGGYTSLLSGGKDSVAATHYLSRRGELRGCVFIRTGISCPDTCPFVERLCRSQGWPLLIVDPPKSYEELVKQYGFPVGLVGHSWAFGWLKERALRQAVRQLGPGTIFASGARRRESPRRARSVAKGFRHNYGIRIENPIQEWSTPKVWKYLRENGLEVSPAYLTLGRSGDCLCGAFSQRGEAGVIQLAYPDVAERILALENAVARSFPYPKNRWGKSERSMGGFSALRGRLTLEEAVCGGDCAMETSA